MLVVGGDKRAVLSVIQPLSTPAMQLLFRLGLFSRLGEIDIKCLDLFDIRMRPGAGSLVEDHGLLFFPVKCQPNRQARPIGITFLREVDPI